MAGSGGFAGLHTPTTKKKQINRCWAVPSNQNHHIMKKNVFQSTNFTVQSLFLLLFALLELVGFPIEVAEEIKAFVEAALLTGAGFWGYIRTWFAKGIKFEYTGNVLTYVFLFLGGVIQWFAPYSAELKGGVSALIEALTTGNMNLILPALFTIGNILWRIFQDKPWKLQDLTLQ